MKAFSVFHFVPSASRLGLGKMFGEDRAGTVDQTWPKGYSLPYNVFSKKNCGFGLSNVAIACGLAGHRSTGGRWWGTDLASRVFFLSFLYLLNCLYYNPWVFSHFFSSSSLLPTGGAEGSEWAAGGCLVIQHKDISSFASNTLSMQLSHVFPESFPSPHNDF